MYKCTKNAANTQKTGGFGKSEVIRSQVFPPKSDRKPSNFVLSNTPVRYNNHTGLKIVYLGSNEYSTFEYTNKLFATILNKFQTKWKCFHGLQMVRAIRRSPKTSLASFKQLFLATIAWKPNKFLATATNASPRKLVRVCENLIAGPSESISEGKYRRTRHLR